VRPALQTNDEGAAPFSRFGLTEETFAGLIGHFNVLCLQKTKVRTSDEMPFYDWEAEKLAKVFETFSDDRALCGLIAAMMQCVHDDTKRRLANKTKVVALRKNTIGMIG
jgi:hypothetical protein